MASIIPGFEYDIFISYRQKDNKGDHWVSEFVDSLKTELESTFKEDISVYFDINPHDGLLETHHVDESLKQKLKCLIFIPIISRTYCDSKSFAWEHEFKAFVEMASKDQYGLKVKLPNGNVASRILPVKIHDLDQSDVTECENVIGGFLRCIEFIYKEAGIDKPLTPDDDEKKNLNKTKYKIQVIKVAHSVKEIINGLGNDLTCELKEKEHPTVSVIEFKAEEIQQAKWKPTKNKVKFLSSITIASMLIIAGIVLSPKVFKKDTLERLRTSGDRLSVAVMPFQNMTNDSTWDFWQDLIQDNIITYISNFQGELTARQTESINDLIQSRGITNYAAITPTLAKTISRKLDADVFISGSLQHSGTTLRVNARLIDTRTGEILRSFGIETLYNDEIIFDITDSLSKGIANFLMLFVLRKNLQPFQKYTGTASSAEAYRLFDNGHRAVFTDKNYPAAREWYLKALALDSNFFYAMRWISQTYQLQGSWDKAKEWMQKYYDKRDQMPLRLRVRACRNYASIFGTPYDEIKYSRELVSIDNRDASAYNHIGLSYMSLFQYDKAIPEFEKSLELYNKMGIKFPNFVSLGNAYHKTGQFKKEEKLYKKAEQVYPNDPGIIRRQAILSLSAGKTNAANEYIDKYISLMKESSASDVTIDGDIASIYSDAGLLDKAEEYYRKALWLEPDNRNIINNTSWFLIDKNRDINEGLRIVDKALKLNPDDWVLLGCKGVGLNKLGKNKEAIELLEKSRSLRTAYFHPFFVSLEEAKKAVAEGR